MDLKPEFRKGTWCHGANPQTYEYLSLPGGRKWQPSDQDWQLPENWREIILEGIRERLDKYRSFRLFMDICVRCGACADKCHFFHRLGRSEKHAGAARGAAALHLPERVLAGRQIDGPDCGRAGSDGRCSEGVVLLLSTSARNAGAAPYSAPTASTPPKSP